MESGLGISRFHICLFFGCRGVSRFACTQALEEDFAGTVGRGRWPGKNQRFAAEWDALGFTLPLPVHGNVPRPVQSAAPQHTCKHGHSEES